MIYLKIITLIIGIFFSVSIIINACRGHCISGYNFFIMATAWAVFIFSMGWLN